MTMNLNDAVPALCSLMLDIFFCCNGYWSLQYGLSILEPLITYEWVLFFIYKIACLIETNKFLFLKSIL